jgi:hypothetical protein
MMSFFASLRSLRRPAPTVRPGTTFRPRLETLEDRIFPSTVDLTTASASEWVNGAFFQQGSPQPTGSGVIHSFVRINPGGHVSVEQGYNTDARPLQFDENKSPTFTRSLQLAEAPIVVINGVAYREFLLDINQKSSSPLLSLDELRIYVGNAPDLIGYDPTTNQLAGLSPVYDLDAGGDNTVLLNARLSHGSGSGDMFLYVPDQLLTEAGGNYVYLYSKFGVTISANGGFEEWAVRSQSTELSSLSGTVVDQNGVAQADVLVTLTRTTLSGQTVSVQAWTDINGFYFFSGLTAGTYTLTEQPVNYQTSAETVGTLGGTSNLPLNDFSNINVGSGVIGRNYDFTNVLVLGGS